MASALLIAVLVFQVSVLPDTLGLKAVGRAVNALTLGIFILAALYALASGRARRAPLGFVLSVLLTAAGVSINLGRSLSPESVGAAAALLPWAAALSVPFMRSFDLDRAWRVFYKFMLIGSVLALLEYTAVFMGLMSTSVIHTDRGDFLKGVFTIFNGLSDGTAYYRMYGLFGEPGTYAMFLLPAIAYAWMRSKHLAVALFVGCLYLTDSLGGIAALFVLGVTYAFWRSEKRSAGLLVAVLLGSAVLYGVSGTLRERYNQKGASSTIRESNVDLFRENFVTIVTTNPWGLPLTGESLSELQDVSSNYIGSNFEIYTMFVKGGILACAGYTLLLIWITTRTGRYLLFGDRDIRRGAALVSMPALLTFVFQRETILSSALFAFLFVGPLILAAKSESEEATEALPASREIGLVPAPAAPSEAP